MAKKNFAWIEFQKYNNGPLFLVKTIFRHWNCFLLSVASDGKDEHMDWDLKKLAQPQVLILFLQNITQKIMTVSAPWWNLFDIYFITLPEHFLYG